MRFAKIIGCVLAMWMGASALADTVAATHTGVSPSVVFYYQLDGSVRATHAGIYNYERVGGDYNPLLSGDFVAFCIEINQPARMTRTYSYTVEELEDAPVPGVGAGNGLGMGAAKALEIQKLWAKYYDQAILSANNAAAFQIAIWEIIYDGDLSLSAGGFRARYPSLAPVVTAQNWLKNLTWSGALPDLRALSSPTAQDQVFLAPPQPAPTVVPLPAAAWGGALLLLAIILQNIRRLRGA